MNGKGMIEAMLWPRGMMIETKTLPNSEAGQEVATRNFDHQIQPTWRKGGYEDILRYRTAL